MAAKIEFLTAECGLFEWQLKSANGRVIARSPLYTQKSKMIRAAQTTVDTIYDCMATENMNFVDMTETE